MREMEVQEPMEELPPLEAETPEPARRQRAGPAKRRAHRAARSSTSSSDTKESRLKQIGADLDQTFVLLGTALTPFLPVTGTTLIVRGPQGSDIVCNIARKDERVYRALLAI